MPHLKQPLHTILDYVESGNNRAKRKYNERLKSLLTNESFTFTAKLWRRSHYNVPI